MRPRKQDTKRQAAEIFLKAADYIRTYGWQEKGMGVHGHPRCSMGALASAYPVVHWDKGLAELMYQALYKELNGDTLTKFNHITPNGQKVALLFEQTALSLAPNTVRPNLTV